MCLCDGFRGGQPGGLHGISERLVLTLMLLIELRVLSSWLPGLFIFLFVVFLGNPSGLSEESCTAELLLEPACLHKLLFNFACFFVPLPPV